MAGEKVLGTIQSDLNLVIGALENNAADLPHLDGRKAALIALQTQLNDLNTQQEAAKSAQQELSRQISEAIQQTRDELRDTRSSVKGHYGSRSQKLEEFGIRVRTGGTAR